MKSNSKAVRVASLALSAALCLPLLAQAQNIAPKSRAPVTVNFVNADIEAVTLLAADAASLAVTEPAELPAVTSLLADALAEHHTTWEVRLFAS